MNELQPFVLEFDSEGKLVQPQQQTDILQAVGAENPTVTDLWVLSYGWNNDIQSTASQQTYQQWTTHLLAEMRQIQNEQYQPLFVELFWPSEAWADAVAQPASLLTPHQSAPTATDREEFSEHYTRLLDPAGRQGADAANDFGYLYDVLTQLRPTEEQTHTFVQRLNKYSLNDPHNDQDEQDTIMVAPVETIVQRLLAGPLLSLEPSLLAARSEVPHAPAADTTLLENLLNFFRVFTFWTMKARSAVVGTQGVYPFLKQVKQTREPHERPLRIHLLGHSFGAK